MPNPTQNSALTRAKEVPTHLPEIQSEYLEDIADHATNTTVYLASGFRLNGRLTSFDAESLILDTAESSLLVFTHGISSLTSH